MQDNVDFDLMANEAWQKLQPNLNQLEAKIKFRNKIRQVSTSISILCMLMLLYTQLNDYAFFYQNNLGNSGQKMLNSNNTLQHKADKKINENQATEPIQTSSNSTENANQQKISLAKNKLGITSYNVNNNQNQLNKLSVLNDEKLLQLNNTSTEVLNTNSNLFKPEQLIVINILPLNYSIITKNQTTPILHQLQSSKKPNKKIHGELVWSIPLLNKSSIKNYNSNNDVLQLIIPKIQMYYTLNSKNSIGISLNINNQFQFYNNQNLYNNQYQFQYGTSPSTVNSTHVHDIMSIKKIMSTEFALIYEHKFNRKLSVQTSIGLNNVQGAIVERKLINDKKSIIADSLFSLGEKDDAYKNINKQFVLIGSELAYQHKSIKLGLQATYLATSLFSTQSLPILDVSRFNIQLLVHKKLW